MPITTPDRVTDPVSPPCPTDSGAIGASSGEVRRLIDHLARAHDLTLAEAADAIAEWQAGLSGPTTPVTHLAT
jgi:hypothetical protein